ncbi:MAG: amidohydrolase [Candidatus Kuenenia sp.]|nr:amidohydrolase [Candidatus Kuenenia hertensis]
MPDQELVQSILLHARDAQDYIVRMRRDFHKYPELSFNETRSAQVIAAELKQLGLHVQTGIAKTGIIASLPVAGATRTVAFRADMDALPIEEENDLDYKSSREGIFHACGHDANMAMLLGAAKIIVSLKDKLKRQVRFLFQPGEEQPPGGANYLIEQGALCDVDEIYGLHIDPNLPSSVFGLRSGATMASTDRIIITIQGKGGHSSTPHLCIDPIVIAAEIILAIQTIISRKLNPVSRCTISLCQISGGTAFNVIPSRVKILGTARSLDDNLRNKLPSLIEETVRGITSYNNASYEFEYLRGYPILYNHQEQVDFVREKIISLFGDNAVINIDPILGGEDFSYYLKKTKGAFVFLGSGNQEKGTNQPLHSPQFLIDEDILCRGSALLACIACSSS